MGQSGSSGWRQPIAGVLAGLVLAIGFTSAGCTRDPEAAPSPSTTPVAATTPPATQPDLLRSDAPLSIASYSRPEELDAARDLLRAQQAILRAEIAPVNPDSPELDEWLIGDALTRNRDRIRKNIDDDRSSRDPTIFRLRIESARSRPDNSLATTACLTLRQPFVQTSTGQVVDDAVFSVRVEYLMVPPAAANEHWMLSREGMLADSDSEDCPAP